MSQTEFIQNWVGGTVYVQMVDNTKSVSATLVGVDQIGIVILEPDDNHNYFVPWQNIEKIDLGEDD